MDNANVVVADEEIHPDMQILKGNVRFRRDNAILYCDSAYFYQKPIRWMLLAMCVLFREIHFFVTAIFFIMMEIWEWPGLRHNVRMETAKPLWQLIVWTTTGNSNLAYYYTGGKIVDPENTLTSVWGSIQLLLTMHCLKQRWSSPIKLHDGLGYHEVQTQRRASLMWVLHIFFIRTKQIFSRKRLVQYSYRANDVARPIESSP